MLGLESYLLQYIKYNHHQFHYSLMWQLVLSNTSLIKTKNSKDPSIELYGTSDLTLPNCVCNPSVLTNCLRSCKNMRIHEIISWFFSILPNLRINFRRLTLPKALRRSRKTTSTWPFPFIMFGKSRVSSISWGTVDHPFLNPCWRELSDEFVSKTWNNMY